MIIGKHCMKLLAPRIPIFSLRKKDFFSIALSNVFGGQIAAVSPLWLKTRCLFVILFFNFVFISK